MSSEVRHLVNHEPTFPLVRLTGVLDAHTSGTVRSALLDVLAGQPEAVVVDVADLRLSDPEAVVVLRDLKRDTADWPAARFALCGSADPVWRATGWPVWPDSAHAYADLGSAGLGVRLAAALEPQVGAARRSRELITEACVRWDRPELAGAACIVATELVNNVVAHARTAMTVLLAVHGDGLSVAVRDQSAGVPVFNGKPVSPTAYGGRGMLLIDSVASRWGSLVLADGKVVWALLAPDPVVPDQHGDASMVRPARG